MGSSVILPSPGQPREGPDPSFHTPAVPNLVKFKFELVDPPAALYIQRDDLLTLEGFSTIAGESLILTMRLLLPFAQAPGQPDKPPESGPAGGPLVGPGYIQTIQVAMPMPLAQTSTAKVTVLTEGYLLSLSILANQAAVRGQTFARSWLARGPSGIAPANSFEQLAGGYCTTTVPVVWPNSSILLPTDGAGFVNVYTPANPAAGADINVSTTRGARSRLQGFKATLVTSAAAGNRFPSFEIADTAYATFQYQVQDTVAVPAATTITYSLAPGGTNVRGAGAPIFATLPLPSPFFSRGNIQIASVTQGLLGGDQWSALVISVEEWFDSV